MGLMNQLPMGNTGQEAGRHSGGQSVIYHVCDLTVEMEDSREETEVEGPGQDGRKRSPEVLIVEDVYSES